MKYWWNCTYKDANGEELTQTFYTDNQMDAVKKMQNWIYGRKSLWVQGNEITAVRSANNG